MVWLRQHLCHLLLEWKREWRHGAGHSHHHALEHFNNLGSCYRTSSVCFHMNPSHRVVTLAQVYN